MGLRLDTVLLSHRHIINEETPKMFDNKPFEEIEKQAKHVIDLLNQEAPVRRLSSLKPFVPA